MDEQKEVVYISHNDKITSENVNCYYEDGLTPLTYVLVNDYYERAEKYLELGADPYLKDLKGRFPIDIVLQTYRYYIISLLLEHGFDIRQIRSDGETYLEYFFLNRNNNHLSIALDYCSQEEFDRYSDKIKENIVNYFISRRKIFSYYTEFEESFLIEQLMSKGLNPVSDLKDGTNLLMIISCVGIGNGNLYGLQAISEYLGTKLPDVINLQDNKGLTALFYSAEFCRSKETLFLIQNGASLTIKDNDGNTFLGYMLNRLKKIIQKEPPFAQITQKVHGETSESLTEKIFYYFSAILPELRLMGYDLDELAGVDLRLFFDKLENRDFIRFYLQMTNTGQYLNFTDGLLLDKQAKFTGEWVIFSESALDTNFHLNSGTKYTALAFDGFYVITGYLKGLKTRENVIPLFDFLKNDFSKTEMLEIKSSDRKSENGLLRNYELNLIDDKPLPEDKPLQETKFKLIDEEITIYTIPGDKKNRGYILYKGKQIKVSTIDIYDYQSEAYDRHEIRVSVSTGNVSLEEFFVREECVKVEKIKYEDTSPLYIVKADVINRYDGIIYIDLVNLKALIIKVDSTYSVY